MQRRINQHFCMEFGMRFSTSSSSAEFHHAAPNFIIQRRIVDAGFVIQRRISSYSAESEIAPNSSADSDSALYDNHPAPNYSAELFYGLLPTYFKKAVSTRGRAHNNLQSAVRKQLMQETFVLHRGSAMPSARQLLVRFHN